MDMFTINDVELREMDFIDSFNEAYDNGWLQYALILIYRFYGNKGGDEDSAWYGKLYDFWLRYMLGRIKQPFSVKDYLENEKYNDMRKSIKAFGLEFEKFWMLMLFIYDYVSEKLTKGNVVTNVSMTAFAQNLMRQIEDADVEEVEIIIKNKGKKIPISGVGKKSIITMLIEGYNNLYKDAVGYEFLFSDLKNKVCFSCSYQITMAVDLYEHTFDYLDNEWNMIHPERSTGVSLNKMLLFSQIMHLYRWTNNDNFLYDDSSLKGVLKTYKQKPMPQTISDVYW